ncbi:Rho termination factor N-terminal domain-containing protein [Enterococcus faecium]|uniref:Rho termination factor N-terminal domain-containing protein n=1 Tax=Enterococcus faecium TaxID=1352 RepID=UPI0039891B0B
MAIIKIRTSITGTEYWDSEKKKTVVVPKGQEPDFEVTENPKSMITPEGDKVVAVLDHSAIPDLSNAADFIHSGTINQEGLDSDRNTKDDLDGEPVTNPEEEQPSELDSMNTKDLRAYAKKNGIEIPAAIRAKGDIINLIREAE